MGDGRYVLGSNDSLSIQEVLNHLHAIARTEETWRMQQKRKKRIAAPLSLAMAHGLQYSF
jgi:hypothetical protein